MRDALRKAETNLSNLRRATGGDEAGRFRLIHNQEKVVRAFRRLVNINTKPQMEVIQINGNF